MYRAEAETLIFSHQDTTIRVIKFGSASDSIFTNIDTHAWEVSLEKLLYNECGCLNFVALIMLYDQITKVCQIK